MEHYLTGRKKSKEKDLNDVLAARKIAKTVKLGNKSKARIIVCVCLSTTKTYVDSPIQPPAKLLPPIIQYLIHLYFLYMIETLTPPPPCHCSGPDLF